MSVFRRSSSVVEERRDYLTGPVVCDACGRKPSGSVRLDAEEYQGAELLLCQDVRDCCRNHPVVTS